MRKSSVMLSALVLLAATPAFAGSLTFDNGVTTWHSTQCPRPTPPASIYNANSETSGDDMNSLVAQHNAYVDTAQTYMDCVSQEAERDQAMISQSITAAAQAEIATMKGEVDADARAVQKRKD